MLLTHVFTFAHILIAYHFVFFKAVAMSPVRVYDDYQYV